MTPPLVYLTERSPPCRSVLLAVAAAGIEIDIQEISLLRKDHLKEEFVKMNPQHTIPTLNDNGFILSDSHAIVTYLIDKYAKDDSLYPKDLQKRALVNQFLHFNNSVLFSNIRRIFISLFHKGVDDVCQEIFDLTTACEVLETYLGAKDWLAGDKYTLADTSVISTVSCFPVFLPLDKFPKLAAWVKRCEDQLPSYRTVNVPGNTMFINAVRERFPNQ